MIARKQQRVVSHELFHMMRETTLTLPSMHNFLAGVWPVIEVPAIHGAQPAESSLRSHPGPGHGAQVSDPQYPYRAKPRGLLIAWAAASGVSQEDLLYGSVPLATHALSHWCWHTCERDGLAAGMAATNYAIEGATGEWAQLVCSSDTYENSFDPSLRRMPCDG